MSKSILSPLVLIISVFLMTACDKDNPYEDFTREQLSKSVSEKYEAILNFAQPTSCTDPAEWHLMEIESVCDPSYIAYHESVDKRKLTALVQDYNLLMEIYGPLIASYVDCLSYGEPIGVVCEDGKAMLKYETFKE